MANRWPEILAILGIGVLVAFTLVANAEAHHSKRARTANAEGKELRPGCQRHYTLHHFVRYTRKRYARRTAPLRAGQKVWIRHLTRCVNTLDKSRWAKRKRRAWRAAFRARRWHQKYRLCGTPTCNGRLVYWMESRRSNTTQGGCLKALAYRESGWSQYADNPTSSAYGIPQALPGSKMASHGADWATNPVTQIRWMMDYVRGRYGSACGALAHSNSAGWY